MGGASVVEEKSSTTPDDAQRVLSIPILMIDPDRAQPRRQFGEEALAELAASIESVGVIQPVLVRALNGRYQLIAGERRWRAARIAGLDEIPAIVHTMDDAKRLEVALIENLQRDNLNPIEEAQGIKQLMEQCAYTQDAAAKRLGKSRPAVANLLRLLSLDEKLLDMVRDGRLSAGHARALVALDNPGLELKLAKLCIAQGW